MEVRDFLTLVRFRNTTIVVFYVLIFSASLIRRLILPDLLLIFLSNLLAVWSIYIYNDYEDARIELGFKKRRKFFHKNLILGGKISGNEVLVVTSILAVMALMFASNFGLPNFLITATILCLGILYSERHIKLKSRPPFDVLSHGLIGPLISLSILIDANLNLLHVLALSSFFLGSIVTEILNQRYDYFIDKKNKVKTTVQIFGRYFSLKLIISMTFSIIVINGTIFFLYGGENLALIYLILSPLLIMFLFKEVRQLIEKKPIILGIPVIVNLLVLFLGFLNIV